MQSMYLPIRSFQLVQELQKRPQKWGEKMTDFFMTNFHFFANNFQIWPEKSEKFIDQKVKNKMMNPKKFYTKVPFQTMSADHEKFNPLKGYWRGPNWLDQAYFGVKGLRNYGYNEEADKATLQILEGAEGVLEKGKSIRENYHPITGKGLNAKNFSWSAAHIIMLLMKD